MRATAIALSFLMLAFSFVFSVQCRAGSAEGGAAASPTGTDDNVKFALHLVSHGSHTCKTMPSIGSFSDITRTWSQTGPGADVDVFFVVFDYDSLYTLEYGMNWPADWGTGIFTVCPPALFLGGIASPGDGVAITYPDCQVSAAQGGSRPNFWTMCWTWLTPMSDGTIELISNPGMYEAVVVDCRPLAVRRKHYPVAMYNASVDVEPQPSPTCSVEPESLQFDPVGVGEGSEQQTFTITNIGEVPLAGTVSEACHAFSIVSGGGAYSLAPGESRTVTMLFAPPTTGTKTCYVQTGATCPPVVCRGVALPPPTCEVNPTKLNFGVVPVGGHADLALTITNIGSGTLEGVVSDTCSAYSIVGDSAYSLGYGESKEFTVRFSPTAPLVQSCKVKGTTCAEVTCTGEGMHFSPVDPTGESQPVVIQAASIDGLTLVKGDEIGIFDGSLCVGAAKFSGPYPFAMTAWMRVQLPDRAPLPGAIPGHTMVLKTWQSAYSRECPATATYAAGSGTFGEPATVVSSLQGLCPSQAIDVSARRINMISMNFKPYDLAAAKVFADLGSLQVAKDDAGKFYLPGFNVNTIGKVDVCKAYQVFIGGTQPDQMVVEGTPLDPTACCYTWDGMRMYAIGYPYQVPQPVAQAFAPIASDVVVVQDDVGRYWIPSHGINTIGNLLPGKGYQIFVDGPVPSFCYPSLAAPLAAVEGAVASGSRQPSHFGFQVTGMSQAIVVSGSNVTLSAGDEIAVYDGPLCVGATVFEGTFPTVVAAWQGEPQWDLKGFTSGDPITLQVWRKGETADLSVETEFADQAQSLFGAAAVSDVEILSVTGAELPKGSGAFKVSSQPNPFETEAEITYEIPTAAHVSLVIYDTRGRVVRRLADAWTDAGAHHATWDGSDDKGRSVAAGIYFCRLSSGHRVTMGTMVIAK